MAFCMRPAPWVILSSKWMRQPTLVPRIREKMTAGMFSMSTMEAIPIPMALRPKIMFSFSL